MQKAVKKPGAFRKWASERGMSTEEAVRTVLANPDRYDATTVRRANLARIFMRAARKRKKKSKQR